ncbi:hypothetical protein PAHAL_6G225900 [Panicum hallii]|uniref:Uncharacterized protein n=1 Tax=Panicum hallii TaxID=206008 RepID=A0A2S3I303_9POAL|nr:hypothetical protein PAHAL_6G225900 [Panicum hallii]
MRPSSLTRHFLRRRRVRHRGIEVVSLVHFEEGLDLFPPLVESSYRPLVILLAVAYLSFRPPLVIANGGVGSYGRFNFQKIWLMCWVQL